MHITQITLENLIWTSGVICFKGACVHVCSPISLEVPSLLKVTPDSFRRTKNSLLFDSSKAGSFDWRPALRPLFASIKRWKTNLNDSLVSENKHTNNVENRFSWVYVKFEFQLLMCVYGCFNMLVVLSHNNRYNDITLWINAILRLTSKS